MTEESPKPKRRVRYQGTHPRHFGEKYKELNPDLHGAEGQKVMDRGHTPAGTHRPICVAEVLLALDPKPGETGLDATLGFGGHAQEILPRIQPGGVSSASTWIPWSSPVPKPGSEPWVLVRIR